MAGFYLSPYSVADKAHPVKFEIMIVLILSPWSQSKPRKLVSARPEIWLGLARLNENSER